MAPASNSDLALLMGLVMVSVRTLGAVDSSMIHARALATSSSMICPTEAQACGADAVCTECLSVMQATMEECFAGLNSSTADCNDFGDGVCCAIAPGDGCPDSSVFEEYLGCAFESVCPVDFDLCTDGGTATTPTTTTTSAEDVGDESTTITADPTSTTDSRGLSGSDSTTTADATLPEASSAPPSVVATMTTGVSLILAVVVVLTSNI